jgi:hypothetical protein
MLDALVFGDQLCAGDRPVIPTHPPHGDLAAVELSPQGIELIDIRVS